MTRLLDAQRVIDRFQHTAPVDVTGLAEALGLAVWEDEDLPENVSGKIFLYPEGGSASGYSIVVPASDPYVRRRFTVAHELAHFLLHQDRVGACLTDDGMYRSGLSSWEEVEANLLAADILMPEHLVESYARAYGADAFVLAPLFKVSEAAMNIRLNAIGSASKVPA